MILRIVSVVSVGCALALSPVFVAAQANNQEQGYYTYVSQWQVPRADWAAFEKQEKEDDATMQKLVSDGTIISWGDEAARVHTPEGYTHADWFTATSRANLLKALEQMYGSATNSAFVATTKHADLLLHTIAHGGKTAASGTTGYLRVTFWQAKPGEGDALESYVLSTVKPILDKDIEDGTLLMYNFDEEDIHTSEPGGYNLALLFPDGASFDKFFDALMASGKQNPGVGQVLDSLTVAKGHRDDLGRVTAYQHK
ncbi:MAG TPA: hypothetical protein VJS11_02170 [Acidobacteriaceae bacterium]|nr:hypothetical protein [Acidobacteriaceae bacterium]